jgi:hypothetical protein
VRALDPAFAFQQPDRALASKPNDIVMIRARLSENPNAQGAQDINAAPGNDLHQRFVRSARSLDASKTIEQEFADKSHSLLRPSLDPLFEIKHQSQSPIILGITGTDPVARETL